LAAAGYEAVGLDLSPYMIQLANRKVEKSGKSIALVRGDGRMLPFCQDSFDSILSTFPTEFLAEQQTINGLYAVLKPGGRLVIVPQAQLTGDSVTTRFIEWLYAITGQRPQVKDARDNGIWQTIANQFRASGFEVAFEHVILETSNVMVVVAEKSD
jgi:ubiquinone/menaquinone biosynthesis C-methylase UbiE